MPHYSQLEDIHLVKHTDSDVPTYYIRANWSDPTSQVCLSSEDYPDHWGGTPYQVANFNGIEAAAKLFSEELAKTYEDDLPVVIESVERVKIVDRDGNRCDEDGTLIHEKLRAACYAEVAGPEYDEDRAKWHRCIDRVLADCGDEDLEVVDVMGRAAWVGA